MAPVSRVRGYVWRHGRQNQNPQSPRHALVCLIIPVQWCRSRARTRVSRSWRQSPAYNAAIMRVAAEFPRVSTIDFYTTCNNILDQCLGDDGIHLTPAGYDLLTPLWFHAVQSIADNRGGG